ncbi:MAG: hypothetical protein JOZ18_21810 [Chloroflexi bacterium]|nr:hypothetical protein [Chloroflexota bacterium]
MKQLQFRRVRTIVGCIFGLCIMMLFAACAGVSTTTNASGATVTNITGTVVSVNGSAHTATLNVGGQTITVSNLTDQEVLLLQGNQGKPYTFQVTQTGNTAYSIDSNTEPQEETTNATPEANNQQQEPNNQQQEGVNEPGSIDFIGKVQSVSSSNIEVSMPGGDSLSMSINATTDRSDLLNGQVSQGQQIKVKAIANADGSFTAEKLGYLDAGDTQDTLKINTVDFSGVTTSAVSNNTVHFKVGNKSFSYSISSTSQVEDYANAQAIGSNQQIKVDVLFSGSNGSIVKIGSDNNNN